MTIINVIDPKTGEFVEIDSDSPTGTLNLLDEKTGEFLEVDLSSLSGTINVIDANTGEFVSIDLSSPAGTVNVINPITGAFIEIDLSSPPSTIPMIDENSGEFMDMPLADTISPTVTITTDEADPTIVSPITFRFTWSEAVAGFVVGDVTIGNGTADTFTVVSTSVYTLTVIPNAGATVTIDVAAGVCTDLAGNSNMAATQESVASKVLLWDDFTDTVAAGSVNGTAPTPGPGGNRVVVDTNTKISIGSGKLSCATGNATNDGIWWSSITRNAQTVLLLKFNRSAGITYFGTDNNQSGSIRSGMFSTANINIWDFSQPAVGSNTISTDYIFALVIRATGLHVLVKGNEYTNWTLLYINKGNASDNPFYPVVTFLVNSTSSLYYARALKSAISSVVPLVSDSFNRSDGSLGTADGAGSEESGGTASWTDQIGTWAVSTNTAAASSAPGIATVPCGTINVLTAVDVTRSAGVAGIVLRYADSNNYVIAYHDGTNAKLDKVVAGVTTNVISAAATYSAGARLVVSARSTKFRLYYNNALIGSEGTISDAGLQTGQAHGLYTTDTGNSLDNFASWATGDGGEYAALDNYIE